MFYFFPLRLILIPALIFMTWFVFGRDPKKQWLRIAARISTVVFLLMLTIPLFFFSFGNHRSGYWGNKNRCIYQQADSTRQFK